MSSLQQQAFSQQQAYGDLVSRGLVGNHGKVVQKHDLGHAFTAILFALFLIALLLAILCGTQVYRSLTDMRDAANSSRLASSLVANTIRANDEIDSVAVSQGPEGRSLVLIEKLESGNYETRLYLHQGYLVEEYAISDTGYTPERATQIVKTDTFFFSYSGGLLTVSTDEGTVEVALRSVEGGV